MSTQKQKGNGNTSLVSKLAEAVKFDNWQNLLTGLGVATRDKLESTTIEAGVPLSEVQLEILYRDDDMAARICDTVPEEMLRKGFEVQIDSGEEATEIKPEDINTAQSDIKTKCDGLGIQTKFIEAMVWARLFGGSVIVIGANDGASRETMKEPLNEARISEIESLNVIDRRYVAVASWYDDPIQSKYGEPKTYYIQNAVGSMGAVDQLEIHETRIIPFHGTRSTIQRKQELDGWSDSVLQRVHKVLRNFNVGWQGCAHLFTDASQAVYKMKDLIKTMSSNNPDTIMRRMRVLDMNRSVARAIAIDSDGEEFERQKYDFGNIDSVLQMFILRLSAAARMPATILMGQSPAGMDATGDSDFRWFYDTIATARENDLKPKLRRVVELIMVSSEGPTKGKKPDNWSIQFPSLWQMTPKEESEVRKNTADTDDIYINQGVVLPEEVTLSRFGPHGYSPETTVDLDLRRDELEFQKEKARAALEEEPDPPEVVPPEPPVIEEPAE